MSELILSVVRGVTGNSRVHLQRVIDLVERYNLHPLVHTTFEWTDAHKAFEELRLQSFAGKIVVKV